MEGSVKVEKYIMADDSRLNYCFIKKEELENPNKDLKVEWDEIDRDQIDYGVVVEKGEPETEESVGTLDKVVSMSMLSIKNEEDAIDWYKDKHSNLPDGMAEIFAKYHFGKDSLTGGGGGGEENAKARSRGTQRSSDKKKTKKKKGENTLQVRKGKFVVKFD